jgi:hypothetical protein
MIPTVTTRLGLFALSLVAFGSCGASQAAGPTTRPAGPPPSRLAAKGPSWLTRFPLHCALGDSGPTLKPADALAEARRIARARLATAGAKVAVKSIVVDTSATGSSSSQGEVSLEKAEGWTTNSQIAAMWYDEAGVGPEAAPGCAYAVACSGHGNDSESLGWGAAAEPGRAGPLWIYNVPQQTGRMCAVGFSGPTLSADDADKNAEEAAREQLAEGIALKATTAMALFDSNEVLYGAVTEICATCAETAEKGKLVDTWRDTRGEGPLPYSGTAFALVCLDL